jgi:hypothetical protein
MGNAASVTADATLDEVARGVFMDRKITSEIEVLNLIWRHNLLPLSAVASGIVNIFIDFSNLMAGAPSILNLHEVHDLILNDRTPGKLVCYGSEPANVRPNNRVYWQTTWNNWRDIGYYVHVSHRAEGVGEELVDDGLVAQMQRLILGNLSPGQTLVLVTGDGNDNDCRPSFLSAVQHALRFGWRVELWSWKAGCSGQYKRLADATEGGRFSIHYLDEHRSKIVLQARQRPAEAPEAPEAPMLPRQQPAEATTTPATSTTTPTAPLVTLNPQPGKKERPAGAAPESAEWRGRRRNRSRSRSRSNSQVRMQR